METLERPIAAAPLVPNPWPALGSCSGFFSIDSESTLDVDDALSIERLPEGVRIRVAIANASAHVPIGSVEDLEAQRRVATTYAADRVVHRMLPRRISERVGSLLEGKLRKAVVFDIVLNNDLDVVSFIATAEKITVDRRLSYGDIPAIIASDADPLKDHLSLIALVSRQLLMGRRKRGALAIYDLNMMLASDEEGNVKQFDSKAETIGYIIVQETMILVNALAAPFLIEHNIPAVYRNHEAKVAAPPSKEIASTIEQWFIDGRPDEETVRSRLHILLGKARYEAVCRGHYALSLAAYGHFTSPLRRFADLVNQRQLVAHIKGEEFPYTQEQLNSIAEEMNEAYDRRKQERSAGFRAAVTRAANKALASGNLSGMADHEMCALIKQCAANDGIPSELSQEIVRRAKAEALTDKVVVCLLFEVADVPLPAEITAALLEWIDNYPGRPVSMCAIGERVGAIKSIGYQNVPLADAKGYMCHARIDFADDKPEIKVVASGLKRKDAEHAAALQLLALKLGATAPIPAPQAGKVRAQGSGRQPDVTNPKGTLLELCVQRKLTPPVFDITGKGPAHAMKFGGSASMTVYDQKLEVSVKDCATKKHAEARAARQLLALLADDRSGATKKSPGTAEPPFAVAAEGEGDGSRASSSPSLVVPQEVTDSKNPKSDLLEYCANRNLGMPEYLTQAGGPAHAPTFSGSVSLVFHGERLTAAVTGCGTKKQAEATASQQLLFRLMDLNRNDPVQSKELPSAASLVSEAASSPNPVGAVQEIAQRLACPLPEYLITPAPGKPGLFQCRLTTFHAGAEQFVGEGSSKQLAKVAAAKAALMRNLTAT